MIGALGVLADESVNLVVGLNVRTRLNLVFDEGSERRLLENLARQTHAGAKFLPIVGVGHVIERDLGWIGRITRSQTDPPARFRSHRAGMGLKPVALSGGLTVIAHGNG